LALPKFRTLFFWRRRPKAGDAQRLKVSLNREYARSARSPPMVVHVGWAEPLIPVHVSMRFRFRPWASLLAHHDGGTQRFDLLFLRRPAFAP
jgi:hypothetical protein